MAINTISQKELEGASALSGYACWRDRAASSTTYWVAAEIAMADPTEQVGATILAAGLTPRDDILINGRPLRFPGPGWFGEDSGWYVLHTDGVSAGAPGRWHEVLTQQWCGKARHITTLAEREAQRKTVDARHIRPVSLCFSTFPWGNDIQRALEVVDAE